MLDQQKIDSETHSRRNLFCLDSDATILDKYLDIMSKIIIFIE